jgi:hypothetical protein
MTNKEQTEPAPEQGSIRLAVPPELRAHYANLALVRGLEDEIVLDFAQGMPDKDRGDVVTRVVMTPQGMKYLRNALSAHIQKYEDQHGEIIIRPPAGELANELFSGKPAED